MNNYDNNNKKSTLGFNYEYSLAISQCNKRLEKLRNEQRNLMNYKDRFNLFPDYRNFLWPLRRPIYPNPMLYAYQFLPPPIYQPLKTPTMTLPISKPNIQYGQKTAQYNLNKVDTFRMLMKGIDNINSNEEN